MKEAIMSELNISTDSEKPFASKEGQEWLKSLMRDGVVTVTFTKKDGSERVMNCTLNESKIPDDIKPTGNSAPQVSTSAVRVFDTDKSEWRSFRWDSIKQINFTLGE